MAFQPPSEVDALQQRLLEGISEALGSKLVGLYVYGSLTLGDFDLHISDVDLLAALSSHVTEAELEELKEMHDTVAAEHPKWTGRVEVQYISLEALQTFREKRSPLGNISPGEPLHLIDAGEDWLMNWYAIRGSGVTLLGPEPTEVIPQISHGEFVAAGRMHGLHYGEMLNEVRPRTWQSYVTLTLCRAMHLVTEGRQVSKRQAAEWAKQRFPDWSEHITNAFSWRARSAENVDPAPTWPQAKAFISFAVEQLRN